MLPLVIPAFIFGINSVESAILGLPIYNTFLLFAGITLLGVVLLPFAIASVLAMGIDN